MDRKWLWRALLFSFFGIFSVVYLLPTFAPSSLPGWYKGYFTKKVLLGLDLAGGVHLEYAIDTDSIIESQLDNWGEDVKGKLMEAYGEKDKENSEHFSIITRGNRLEITFKKEINQDFLTKATADYTDARDPKLHRVDTKDLTVFYAIDNEFTKDLEEKALVRAVDTIRDRVDEFGVASPEIYRKDDMIVVELPGLDKDSQESIKRIIMRSAHLEFKLVDSESQYMKEVAKYLRTTYGMDEAGIIQKAPYKGLVVVPDSYGARKGGDKNRTLYFQMDVGSRDLPVEQQQEFNRVRKVMDKLFREELPKAGLPVPQGREIGFERTVKHTDQGIPTAQKVIQSMILIRNTKVTGEYIVNAQVGYDQQGAAVVNARFNRTGGKYFGDLTGKHMGWKMAIKLDEWVESAPVIQDEIFENVQISLGVTGSQQERYREAEELVGVLRSGSLPAPLSKEMELNKGPSLGKDAIRRGTIAFIIGIILVVGFMIFYYRWSGLIAVSALGLNVTMMMAIMAAFEARLTLPGIAGIVLTLGMAVDANIIIFERIREELRLGKNPRAAIEAGYGRAFWTIMDSQITTAIAGIVLYEFGTGPIKGFAVTLIIGIITSVVTGVFFTRVVYDFVNSRKKLENLSI
ncbi:protein translocase subunit SecD [Myxococcota bacterium]|nr:protein translocase subunit SecD [Myxococcota bacterium]